MKYGDIKEKKEESDEEKIFIYDLIRYFGLNFEELYDSLKYPRHLIDQQFTREKIENDEEIPLLIQRMFANQKSGCFSIGEIGRYKINKKLGLNLPKDLTYLSSHDFIGIVNGLIELKYYNRVTDDIDHIKNKQVRSIGELLQNQLRVGFYRLQKNLNEFSGFPSKSQKLNFDLETSNDPDDWIIDPRAVTNSIKEFFKTYN